METKYNGTTVGIFVSRWILKMKKDAMAMKLSDWIQIVLIILQVIILIYQTRIIWRQTEILGKQTNFQIESAKQQERILYSANWGELRNAMWEIMDQIPSSGINELESLSQQEKAAWLKKVRQLLDSQIKNPVLIENKECLGYWRNAISAAKTALQILPFVDKDLFINQATTIFQCVMHVWEKIVLDSHEVSATGGIPVSK